jgi:putative ABC transport system ATP-binding protein
MMVTHDAFSASFCKEVLFFDDGAITKRIENDTTREGFYKRILTELDQQGGSTDEPQ